MGTILVEHGKRVVDSHRSNLIAPFHLGKRLAKSFISCYYSRRTFLSNSAVLDLAVLDIPGCLPKFEVANL